MFLTFWIEKSHIYTIPMVGQLLPSKKLDDLNSVELKSINYHWLLDPFKKKQKYVENKPKSSQISQELVTVSKKIALNSFKSSDIPTSIKNQRKSTRNA